MKKYLSFLSICACLLALLVGCYNALPAFAQSALPDETPSATASPIAEPAKTEYFKARVMKILEAAPSEDQDSPAYGSYVQNARILFLNGPEKGQGKDVPYYPKSDSSDQRLKVGQTVYVTKVSDAENTYYAITEQYRLNVLLWAAALFVLLVLITARLKGFGSMLGLGFSLLVIVKFMVPAILGGHNPLIVCLIGAMAIALVAIYIAHGFSLRTSLAVASTMIIIAFTAGLDWILIHAAKLFGSGTEEAVYAQFGNAGTINLRGLLLGGIIIGVLGVLDDITTAQAAVVDELRRANPSFGFKELYVRATSVGREHIASLINTLVLAYVGASFPLVLLFQHYEQPLAYILNSELVAEEIARTLIGSTALILAVPLTTALAAYVLSKRPISKDNAAPGHQHSH